jgi:hypothetical protein
MEKFNKKYELLMESFGSEATIPQGIYDLYMNLILDAIQIEIKKALGTSVNIEIVYEKTYNELRVSTNDYGYILITINEIGEVFFEVKLKDEPEGESEYKKSFILDSIENILNGEFAHYLYDAYIALVNVKK